MRLLTKTTLYFLAVLIPLLAIAGYLLFYQFSKELNARMDEELVAEEIQWIRYLRSQTSVGTTFILRTPDILIYPVDAPVASLPEIRNTEDYDAAANQKILYRQLSHIVSINGIPYQITIRKSQQQRAALVTDVTRLMMLVFIGLFIATLLFNWFISNELWKPFRRSLQKIKGAELQKMEALRFTSTGTKEFNELNTSLNLMANKIHQDYVSMKEFTENAAHEMQTPLAVVQSKLELLLQDSRLDESQMNTIVQASTALDRLSKLNKSLLLLAKIENHQFDTHTTISLAKVTQKYLQLFDEMIKDKNLVVETDFNGDWLVNLHPLLADSLVSNLVGNAIKYNHQYGILRIAINPNRYSISNSSNLPPIDPQQLFKRFNRTSDSADTSNGLGLSIVKKIADTNHMQVSYNAKDGIHHFVVEQMVME